MGHTVTAKKTIHNPAAMLYAHSCVKYPYSISFQYSIITFFPSVGDTRHFIISIICLIRFYGGQTLVKQRKYAVFLNFLFYFTQL